MSLMQHEFHDLRYLGHMHYSKSHSLWDEERVWQLGIYSLVTTDHCWNGGVGALLSIAEVHIVVYMYTDSCLQLCNIICSLG